MRRGHMTGPGQELFDFPSDVGSANPRDMVGGGKLDVVGFRDVLGQVAAVSGADVSVVAGVDNQRGYRQITEQRGRSRDGEAPGAGRWRATMRLPECGCGGIR